ARHRARLFRRLEPFGGCSRPRRAARHGQELDSQRTVEAEGGARGCGMNHSDPFRELVEGYALGALDPEERTAFEAHLARGCAACTRALEESRWLVSQLAYLAPEAEPSGLLRGRLVETVRFEATRARVPAPRPKSVPLWMWGAVAAAVLFALYNYWEAS